MPNKIKIAICQLNSSNKKDDNIKKCCKYISECSKDVRLVCFPECAVYIGIDSFGSLEAAENIDKSKTLDIFKEYAKKYNVWISLGGFHVVDQSTLKEDDKNNTEKKDNDDDDKNNTEKKDRKIINTHIMINDKGDIVEKYEKIHLFDVKVPNGLNYQESKTTTGGTKLVVVKTPFGNIGLTICYDLRFPLLYNSLRKLGADILLIPAAFTQKTGKAHWEILLRARAIETQCFVIAAAQVGRHNEENSKRESFGHSMVIDPWGTIQLDLEKKVAFGEIEIDLDSVKEVRTNMPIISHEKKDIYQI